VIVNEHFVPTLGLDLEPYLACGDVNGAQHLIRYRWAIETLAERAPLTSLLDLGCGNGYGCYAIARRFPRLRVVGVDRDEQAIDAGRRSYPLPNLELRVGDARRWEATLGDDHFDCVVSFDSIEHVEHRELYLEGVVEHLTPAGCLMLSTPCGWPANVLAPDWPAHKIEYSAPSLYDLLARYFRTIRRPEDGSLPKLEVFELLAGTGIPYLLLLNPVLCEQPVRILSPYRSPPVPGAACQGITVLAGDGDGSGVDPRCGCSREPAVLRPGETAGEADAATALGPGIVQAVRRLSDEVATLREAVSRQLVATSDTRQLETVIHHLCESLEELEADNTAWRAENERLLAAQEQVLAALASGSEPGPAAASTSVSPEVHRLAEENARLRDYLAWTEGQVAGLRAMERTRAFKLVQLYWSWMGRWNRGRRRPDGG
jgi:2-polyprenyl-3-methyl-5-hydroxy-6-metoxy-1,4-benzoquinol methylase